MSEERFTRTQYPTSDLPKLPEFLTRSGLEGLPPGDVTYPYPSCVVVDPATRLLYIKTKTPLDQEAGAPEYFGHRAGVMRVFEPDGEKLIDGYVADLRRVKVGDLYDYRVTMPPDASETDYEYKKNEMARDGIQSPLAVAFTDPDGNPHFSGDKRFMPHLDFLMTRVDDYNADQADRPTPVELSTPENFLG
jgi:hypothetical protein